MYEDLNDYQPDQRWPEAWTQLSEERRRRNIAEWEEENAELQAARRIRRVNKKLTEDKDYMKLIADARQKLEKDIAPAMRRALRRMTGEETLRRLQLQMMPVRKSHWCTNQVFTRGDAKAAVDKTWNELNTIPWDVKKVRPKSDVIRQAKKDGKTVHFANLMDPLSLEKRRTCKTTPQIQGASRAPGGQCQRRRRTHSSIHRARCFNVSDGSGNILGRCLNAAWFGWRSKWRSFHVHSSQNDSCSQISTNAERRTSWTLDHSFFTTKTEKLGEYWRTLGTSWKELVWSPMSPLSLGKKLWRNAVCKRMEESTCTGNVFTCTSKTVIHSGAKLSARKFCWNRRRRQNRKHRRRFVVYEWRINVSTPWRTSCEALGPREWNVHDPIEIRRRIETKLRRGDTKSLNT